MIKIIKSLAMIATVGALAIGGTYAWDLQTETISGITYSAGIADLKIDRNDSPSGVDWVDSFNTSGGFDKTGLKPGDSGEQIIDIKNEGGDGGVASVRLDMTANNENSRLTPEIAAGDPADGVGELGDNLRIRISYDADNDGVDGFVEKYDYKLSQYDANPSQLNLGEITSTTGIASVKFEWYIPSDAGNKIMTDSVGINIIFGLE